LKFEEKREKEMPRMALLLQTAWRGYLCRTQWGRVKAAIKLQLFYRRYRFNKWFKNVFKTFANVHNDPQYGMTLEWPKPPKVLEQGAVLLKKVHLNWRARKLVLSLTDLQQAEMRSKVLAYTIFRGNKPWDCSRRYEADYLQMDSNPYKSKYIQAIQHLFATYGDTHVHFAEYASKANSKNKIQKRGVVVTDRNIYKHDPKNYKIKKYETPISQLKDIT
jgi:myosin-1